MVLLTEHERNPFCYICNLFFTPDYMFFNHLIDFNTKYVIAGTLALGAAFIGFGFFDKGRAKVIIYPTKRHMTLYPELMSSALITSVCMYILCMYSITSTFGKSPSFVI